MKNRDEFDDPKGNDLLGSVGPKAAFFIVLIALSFMIGVVWKLYVSGGGDNAQNVPIIRAETEPYKVEPVDAGGMDMPHKDSTIFSSLNSDPDADSRIENLLADDTDEKPMPRSELFAGLNTEPSPELHSETQDTPLDQPLSEDQERIVEQAKEAENVITALIDDGANAIVDGDNDNDAVSNADTVADTDMAENTEIKIPEKVTATTNMLMEQDAAVKEKIESAEKALAEKKALEEKLKREQEAAAKAKEKAEALAKIEADKKKLAEAAKKAATASSPATSPAPVKMAGDYYVQLASVQDKSRADAEWKKLKSKYGSALSGYNYRIETAQLAKGTYYRIQAGPVSKSQANKTCGVIKRINASGCLVKKK